MCLRVLGGIGCAQKVLSRISSQKNGDCVFPLPPWSSGWYRWMTEAELQGTCFAGRRTAANPSQVSPQTAGLYFSHIFLIFFLFFPFFFFVKCIPQEDGTKLDGIDLGIPLSAMGGRDYV